MNINIGNKLKQLRKSKALSQEQVAEYLHISQSAYARIERGESISWANHITTICTFFEITPEELIQKGEKSDVSTGLNESTIMQQLSDKVIQQYETRIKEFKKIIKNLKKEVEGYKKRPHQ